MKEEPKIFTYSDLLVVLFKNSIKESSLLTAVTQIERDLIELNNENCRLIKRVKDTGYDYNESALIERNFLLIKDLERILLKVKSDLFLVYKEKKIILFDLMSLTSNPDDQLLASYFDVNQFYRMQKSWVL